MKPFPETICRVSFQLAISSVQFYCFPFRCFVFLKCMSTPKQKSFGQYLNTILCHRVYWIFVLLDYSPPPPSYFAGQTSPYWLAVYNAASKYMTAMQRKRWGQRRILRARLYLHEGDSQKCYRATNGEAGDI
jgi:hypothetical protein